MIDTRSKRLALVRLAQGIVLFEALVAGGCKRSTAPVAPTVKDTTRTTIDSGTASTIRTSDPSASTKTDGGRRLVVPRRRHATNPRGTKPDAGVAALPAVDAGTATAARTKPTVRPDLAPNGFLTEYGLQRDGTIVHLDVSNALVAVSGLNHATSIVELQVPGCLHFGSSQYAQSLTAVCALRTDGTAACVRDGASNETVALPALQTMKDIRSIASLNANLYLVMNDGSVPSLAPNAQDGCAATTSFTEQAALKFSNVERLVPGPGRVYALLHDHSVWGLGSNANGQLGDASETDRTEPVKIEGLEQSLQLSLSQDYGCALLSDHTVKCWGDNSVGQLGIGSTEKRNVPTLVNDLKDVVSIASGDGHTCALLSDRTMRCWGFNEQGQVGDGSKETRTSPVEVSGVSDVESIAAGSANTCALLRDKTVKCWGYNEIDMENSAGSWVYSPSCTKPTLVPRPGGVATGDGGVPVLQDIVALSPDSAHMILAQGAGATVERLEFLFACSPGESGGESGHITRVGDTEVDGRCEVTAPQSFHLRPTAVTASVGTEYPASTKLYVMERGTLTRGKEVIYHVVLEDDGAEGYVFVNPNDVDAECPSR